MELILGSTSALLFDYQIASTVTIALIVTYFQ